CRFASRFKIAFGVNLSTGFWPPARAARRALARRAHLLATLQSGLDPSGFDPWRITRAGRADREGEQPAVALGSAASPLLRVRRVARAHRAPPVARRRVRPRKTRALAASIFPHGCRRGRLASYRS